MKAVAWDIDGTLIDSEPLHHRALVETCARYGVDLSDMPERAFRGVHMVDVWRALRSSLPATLERVEWLEAIERFYCAEAGALAATPGALEVVRALQARSAPQACVSNSSRRVVDANLAALRLGDALAFSISLDDVVAGKPDPAPYSLAAQRLGLAAREIVAVEDSASGAASARAAGLFVVRYDPAGERLGIGDRWVNDLGEVLGCFGSD